MLLWSSCCFCKEFICNSLFLQLFCYLSYLKKKKFSFHWALPRHHPPPRYPKSPPPLSNMYLHLWTEDVLRLDGCRGLSCLQSGMADDDSTGLGFRDLASLLLFTSFRFHLALLTGTLTPSAKLVIKQFWSEEKENSTLKPIWEMSCLVLQKEGILTCVNIHTFMHLVGLIRHFCRENLCADSILFSLCLPG